MQSKALLGLLFFLLAGNVVGQPGIQLKSRTIQTSGISASGITSPFASLAIGAPRRIHLIVQFPHVPGLEDTKRLQDRGASILSYIPVNGLMISIDSMLPLDDLGLSWSGPLGAADKISGMLADTVDARVVVIEFHPDTDMAAARELVLLSGADLRELPDAGSHHLVVSATKDQVEWIAADDSAAYVFPASGDLASGRPLVICEGALTVFGAAGQYTATAGSGWDGGGLGSAAITYSWDAMTSQLPSDLAKLEVVRAFGEWSKAVRVTFHESASNASARNINVLFAKLEHGDGYSFDGRGGILAHTFYPAPPNPEPLAGDMHIDDDEHWQIGADTDLFSVALHEAGHALGLGHSDNPQAVMYPYYSRVTGLNADDIAVIRTLYAAVVAAGAEPHDAPLALSLNAVPSYTNSDTAIISGAGSGGTGAITVAASSDRGWSGTPVAATGFQFNVPLAGGLNTITITASDAASQLTKVVTVNRQVQATAPVIVQISDPGPVSTFNTRLSALTISGTASHSSGIRGVTWFNSSGVAGTANGTTLWNTGVLALAAGANTITISATAGDGTTGSVTIVVNVGFGTIDKTAPALTILSPVNIVSATSAANIVVLGTAADNVSVSKVVWVTGTGETGSAVGTNNWQTPPIPLYTGYNTIVIRAYDAAGNMAWRSVQVTRQ